MCAKCCGALQRPLPRRGICVDMYVLLRVYMYVLPQKLFGYVLKHTHHVCECVCVCTTYVYTVYINIYIYTYI